MIPYADSLYFSLLLYVAAIAIALGLAGRLSWRWVVGINLAMLAVQYGGAPGPEAFRKIWVVAAYGLVEWGVAALFLRLRTRGKSTAVFLAVTALALLPMVAVKLWPDGPIGSYAGFIGMSYVTFRSLDVLICIHDRVIVSLPPRRYLMFLLWFPTMSAGPVDRYQRFAADAGRRRTRAEFLQDLDGAVQRLFRGLLYKFILATLIKQYWLDPVSAETGVLNVVSYMYAYAFYLFFDFAGYSAFAIAASYLLGIRTPENFNRPFLATNIVDFWNRWHITLSTWFRDHVYMRFVMTAMRGRWFASKLVMSCVGFYVLFILMGVWHGLEARYLIYGLYHATLVSGYTILADRRRRRGGPPRVASWQIGDRLVTLHFVCLGLLIFSGRLG